MDSVPLLDMDQRFHSILDNGDDSEYESPKFPFIRNPDPTQGHLGTGGRTQVYEMNDNN